MAGYDRAGFAQARFLQRGVESSLEIVPEAVRHLPDDEFALHPHLAWSDVRAIGNLIRHEDRGQRLQGRSLTEVPIERTCFNPRAALQTAAPS